MSFLTRRLPLRATLRAPRQLATQRFASSDYGSPTSSADPAADPQKAGPNPSADKEHPGPPPPAAGQGTGGATKASKDGHDAPTGQQADVKPTKGNVAQKRGFHSMRTLAKEEGGDKPQPKIHSPEQPKEKQGEDVKKHNEEFEKRGDRAAARSDEKVDKDYWREDKDGKRKG